MNESSSHNPQQSIGARIDAVCDEFEAELRNGSQPEIADFLAGWNLPERHRLLEELVQLELHYRRVAGEELTQQEYVDRYPEVETLIETNFVRMTRGGQRTPRRVRDYDLLQKIGEGGMGAVYLARHRIMHRQVAVKLLPSDRIRSPEEIARFHREVQAVASLAHPNIVQAFDAGEDEGTHYFVMEYLNGVDLKRVVERVGQLSVADACEVIRQAAAGLQHAHEHGMVHRDIKPGNLVLAAPHGSEDESRNQKPVVKVLDLGLARLTGHDSPAADGLTSTGQIMGTLDYIAPEQADDTRSVDIRADIYSLGCTLYTLLTGKPPFSGPGFETVVRKLAGHMSKPVPPICDRRSDVPEELVKTLDGMLAKSPDDRYSTPQEIVALLEPFAAGADLTTLLECAFQHSGEAYASASVETRPFARSEESDELSSESRSSTQSVLDDESQPGSSRPDAHTAIVSGDTV